MSRPVFVPTDEQRRTVEAMVGFGIPETDICQLVRQPKTGKPIDEKTLRKHFEVEIATGAVKVKSLVGNMIVNTILGRTQKVIQQRGGEDVEVEIPLGLVDERARATLAVFFARTRMGWKDTVVNEHVGKDGGPIIFRFDADDATA